MTVKSTIQSEPVLSAAGVTAVVTAGIALLVAFGVPITDAQTVAVVGFVGVLGPIVAAVWARRKVTPVAGRGDGWVEAANHGATTSANTGSFEITSGPDFVEPRHRAEE